MRRVEGSVVLGRAVGDGSPHLMNFQVVPTHRPFVQRPDTQSKFAVQLSQFLVKHLRK